MAKIMEQPIVDFLRQQLNFSGFPLPSVSEDENHLILIFGRSNDWNDEQREAYRILNAAYNQISILTYDHLLFRAKNVLGITEDIDTTDDDELPF